MFKNTIICIFTVLVFITCIYNTNFAQKLTIQEAVNIALINNHDIKRMNQEFEATKANFWSAISPENPKVFTEYEGIPKSRHSLSDYSEKKIGFVQEIQFPLNYIFMGKLHNFEIVQSIAEYSLLRNQIATDVKQCFYYVLLLKEKQKLYEEIVQLTQQLYEKVEIKVKTGESAPYDALKLKVDLAEAENRLWEMKQELDTKIQQLWLLLGKEIKNEIEVEGDLEYYPSAINVDTLIQAALEMHPQLELSKAILNQNKSTRNLSWLELIPNIEIRYFHHQTNESPSFKSWGGEIGLSIPLWFGLKGQGRIRSASYKFSAAKWHVESDKKQIVFNVEKAYLELQLAEKQLQNYRDNILAEVEELVRIATRSYEEGEMGYLEVAEAMRTLNRTKVGYYQAVFDYLVAKTELDKAVGVGGVQH